MAAIAWAALAGFVCYGSLAPFTTSGQRVETPSDISLPDIAQNVLLYLPFGGLGVWTLRGGRSSRTALNVGVTALAAVYSSAMELLQQLSSSRVSSLLDVAANVVGAGAGAVASDAVERSFRTTAEMIRPTGLLSAPARYLLAGILAVIVVAAWYPFDVTLDVSTLSERTRAVRRDPWLWPGMAELWGQGGRFFVFAVIMTACLPGLARRAAPVALIAVVLTAIVIDGGQLAMGSSPVGGAVLLSQAVGAGMGAAVGALVRRTKLATV